MKAASHRDFYNVRKVDTHIHLAAAMNKKQLLRFMRKKMETCGEDLVLTDKGAPPGTTLTLNEVCKRLQLRPAELSTDSLGCHADSSTYQRFDRFNDKYNPFGQSMLREIFMKTDNYMRGRYFAELFKEVITDLEEEKYQMSEPRVSVYGRNVGEWPKLASWFMEHKIFSNNVRWLIQVPRLYHIYKKTGMVNCFADMMFNIFDPLIQVTLDPSVDPSLHYMLQQLVGFDCVDDESKMERAMERSPPLPLRVPLPLPLRLTLILIRMLGRSRTAPPINGVALRILLMLTTFTTSTSI